MVKPLSLRTLSLVMAMNYVKIIFVPCGVGWRFQHIFGREYVEAFEAVAEQFFE